MRKDEDMERRLLDWARWQDLQRGGGAGSFARVDLLEPRASGGYREVPIPTCWVEAEVTDQGVCAMPAELRAAVQAWYLRQYTRAGVPSADAAAQSIGCTRATLHRRVCMAHVALSAWLAERAAVKRQQREQLEALQAAARP